MSDDNHENEFGAPEPTLTRRQAIGLVVAMTVVTALIATFVYATTGLVGLE